MRKNAEGHTRACQRARESRRGWHALTAFALLTAAACGGKGDLNGPLLPGTIAVTTATTGLMQDDGYQLLVDGELAGVIGANDAVSLADLDPATYSVDLGDVAANCSVEGASSVSVASEATTNVSLTVTCAAGDPTAYSIRFGRERPDLDTGAITECPFSICSTTEAWDFYAYYNSASTPTTVIRQNQTNSVEIAHLPGVTLATLTDADVAGATFTTDLVADAFDADRVILLRTDLGALYALGNPVEDTTAQTVDFDVIVLDPS